VEIPEVKITESDIRLSKYIRAMSMPIRVSIIRILLNDDSGVDKDFFGAYSTSAVIVGRHLHELTKIGIIKSEMINRRLYYKINKEVFKELSDDLSLFIGNRIK